MFQRIGYFPPLALALGLSAAPASAAADICRILERGDLTGGAAILNQIVARANCGFDHVACRWTFPYRSSDAGAAAEEIHGAIASCKSLISVESDESVNHPDTYRARIYDFPATTLVLSVKDKAARSETLVTLRTVAKN